MLLFQHKINTKILMLCYVLFFLNTDSPKLGVYFTHISQFRLGIFQRLNSHRCLVAIKVNITVVGKLVRYPLLK